MAAAPPQRTQQPTNNNTTTTTNNNDAIAKRFSRQSLPFCFQPARLLLRVPILLCGRRRIFPTCRKTADHESVTYIFACRNPYSKRLSVPPFSSYITPPTPPIRPRSPFVAAAPLYGDSQKFKCKRARIPHYHAPYLSPM